MLETSGCTSKDCNNNNIVYSGDGHREKQNRFQNTNTLICWVITIPITFFGRTFCLLIELLFVALLLLGIKERIENVLKTAASARVTFEPWN